MLSLSRLVADLYAKDGIRCNAVTPGPTATEAWLGEGGLADQQGEREEVLAKVGAGRPLGRLARARGDRRRDRLPLLRARELRHRRRVERRRRHGPDHHLAIRLRWPGELGSGIPCAMPKRQLRQSFAARIRELEEHALSPLAVRSYETRGRVRPEEECRVRTPFQRDRDRIVHSKPFRRLKGKTQVFIDPAGDHYRTRMTHTLETTGIARVVARALRLNEDLVEAIGLGHDMGHPPFGHAGEDGARRGAARALRRRLPAQRAVAAHRRAAQPDARGRATGSSPTRASASRRRSRARSSASSTASPTSTTTSTTRSATGSSRRPTCRATRSTCSARRARSASTRSSTTWSRARTRAGDIVQSDEVGAAMLSLRAFMFEHVYLGPEAEVEHERARADDRARSSTRSPSRGRPRRRDRRVHRRDDRPLRARRTLRDSLWRGSRTRPSRRSRQAADFVAVVEERTQLRKGGRAPHRAAARSTRSARRASPSTPSTSSTTASAAARAAT